jgi:hypothetical protein
VETKARALAPLDIRGRYRASSDHLKQRQAPNCTALQTRSMMLLWRRRGIAPGYMKQPPIICERNTSVEQPDLTGVVRVLRTSLGFCVVNQTPERPAFGILLAYLHDISSFPRVTLMTLLIDQGPHQPRTRPPGTWGQTWRDLSTVPSQKMTLFSAAHSAQKRPS